MSIHVYPPAMRRLINELTKLPTVGEKTAIRLAYHLITNDRGDSLELAEAIRRARERTVLCEICFSLTEESPCAFCCDAARERRLLCVVEKPADVIALENSHRYRGLYHVLHGLWSPLRGISPEQTKIGALLSRLRIPPSVPSVPPENVEELILATGTTVEGDATALYIKNSVSELGIRVTRIAQGLPKGGELEYADEVTLSHAIEGRRNL